MPGRLIRAEYLDSEAVSHLDDAGEVMLVRLMLVADDYGRFDGRLSIIQRKCWPIGLVDKDPSTEEIERRLAVLEAGGIIVRYEVDGKPYIVIPKFRQRTRANSSKYPPPPPSCLTGVRQMPVTRQTDVGQVTDARPPSRSRSTQSKSYSKGEPVDNIPGPNSSPAAQVAAKAGVKLTTPKPPPSEEPTSSPSGSATKAAPAAPPPDWEDSTQGIDHAGKTLGMKRLPFEEDPQFIDRIHARLALG